MTQKLLKLRYTKADREELARQIQEVNNYSDPATS